MFDKDKRISSPAMGKTNRIIEGTHIEGNISSTTDFRLDGVLIGDFTSKGKLVIGPKGVVKGNITCANVDIEGEFEGVLKITELLSIKNTAKITGDVVVGKLAVEPGAVFEATCKMKGITGATQLKRVGEK